jgi:hypothetical protein
MRARIPAGKAVRRGKSDARAAPASLGTLGIGDSVDREGGLLGGLGALDQQLGAWLDRVEHVERRPLTCELLGVGQAAKRVLRHRPGHRQGALDQLGEHFRRAVARRHNRLLFADQHAQTEILALRAFQLLDLTEPPGVRQRCAFEQHRIGRIGAGFSGSADQILQQVDVVRGFLIDFAVAHLVVLKSEFTMRQ